MPWVSCKLAAFSWELFTTNYQASCLSCKHVFHFFFLSVSCYNFTIEQKNSLGTHHFFTVLKLGYSTVTFLQTWAGPNFFQLRTFLCSLLTYEHSFILYRLWFREMWIFFLLLFFLLSWICLTCNDRLWNWTFYTVLLYSVWFSNGF